MQNEWESTGFHPPNFAPINVWLLQEQKRSIHNVMARCTYHFDGYDIKAINQNLDGENDWEFYFRNQSVASIERTKALVGSRRALVIHICSLYWLLFTRWQSWIGRCEWSANSN